MLVSERCRVWAEPTLRLVLDAVLMKEEPGRALATWLTPAAERRLLARFGDGVGCWLDGLPGRLHELARRWDLALGEVSAGGTSVVVRAVRAGVPVVMKMCPDAAIARTEADALRYWDGSPHVVGLLASEELDGTLLLVGVEPGTRLAEGGWQLGEVAPLLDDLNSARQVLSGQFPSLVERVEFLFDLTRRRVGAGSECLVDSRVVNQAERLAVSLAGDSGAPVRLVHGDLHPGNVLRGPDGSVVAIDPRPARGDPHFDAIDWVLDAAVPSLAGVNRAVKQLAQLVPSFDAERVAAWAVALAPVLAVSQARAGSDADERRARCLMALWDEATHG